LSTSVIRKVNGVIGKKYWIGPAFYASTGLKPIIGTP
jgi:hypothetical protein